MHRTDTAPAVGRAPTAAVGVRARREQTLWWFVARYVPAVSLVALLVLGWQLYVSVRRVPVYLVPGPGVVFQRWSGDLGFFYGEGLITLGEAMLGLAVGGGTALLLGVLLAQVPTLERAIVPLAIALKVTPIVAIAPMFTIWFGFGLLPKVLIAAIITFFPVLINAITGFRAVNHSTLDVLRSLNASPSAIFWKLRLPSALPYLFAALKVSLSLSLIGAMVAEWSGAGRGLGRVLLLAHANLDMPTLVAGVITLATLGIALTAALSILERRVLFWHDAFLDPHA